MNQNVQAAVDHFASLVKMQLERNERIKAQKEFLDYSLNPVCLIK